MSEYLLMGFGLMIAIICVSVLCDYIYHHINIDLYGTIDLKIVHIDMYSSDNRYEDVINVEDMDEVEVKVRDEMVLYDACFTITNNINILAIIEIPTMMVNANKYSNSKELTVLCADKKERRIIIHQ